MATDYSKDWRQSLGQGLRRMMSLSPWPVCIICPWIEIEGVMQGAKTLIMPALGYDGLACHPDTSLSLGEMHGEKHRHGDGM